MDRLDAFGATASLPGVQLRWTSAATQPAPASGVAVFVGFLHTRAGASSGQPVALALSRREDYAAAAGSRAAGFLEHAVHGFFDNGGQRCWIVALPASAQDLGSAPALKSMLQDAFAPGGRMEDLDEPDLVCVPDAVWGPLGADARAAHEVQQAVLAHCARMNDRMALLDCLPRRAATASDPWARIPGPAGGAGHHAANGARYWPWVVVRAAGAGSACVPPSGHIAGCFARSDADRGRHRAPANLVLEGALDIDEHPGNADLCALAAHQVNGLAALPGRGVRILGARTLSDLPGWRHIGARRVVLGLSRWARLSLRDLVLEASEPALWERLRQRVSAWCLQRLQEGALQGDCAREAFYVKCDSETNTAARREAGELVCEVGLATSVPAEFIVVSLVQAIERGSLDRGDTTPFPSSTPRRT
ncbi:MAG: phage tail sheath family protein [Aquabacterium sp.]|nr:MAG: phage tail sheath family protein [Aquabacterium sp.]